MSAQYFYIHDNVHGDIKLPILVKSIIDTPQFQRLRRLKQLGLCSYVYACATHSRFEHCVGTAFLTAELISHLSNNSKIQNLITKQEELCLIIAGLCHDLGHGPFSHFFEKVVPKGWRHEEMSLKMFDSLLEDNPALQKLFLKCGLENFHISLIKGIIVGDASGLVVPTIEIDGIVYSKNFLFQIVCNNEHGIDTDKMDYLKRDSYILNLQCSFNFHRIINNVLVLKSENSLILGFNYKLLLECNEIFHSRWKMQKNVYRHKTVMAVEIMMSKAITACTDVLDIEKACSDPARFLHLTDDFLGFVRFSNFSRRDEVLKILNDIEMRNIFKHGGRFLLTTRFNVNDQIPLLKKNLETFIHQRLAGIEVEVYLSSVEFGFKNGSCLNPLEKITFFKKHDMNPFCISMATHSPLIPKFGSELFLDVYYHFLGDNFHFYKTIEEGETLMESTIAQWWKTDPLALN